MFHNCTCAGQMTPGLNTSVALGQCSRRSSCDRLFKIYMAMSVFGAFISGCGGTPGYIVLLRSEILFRYMYCTTAIIATTLMFIFLCFFP